MSNEYSFKEIDNETLENFFTSFDGEKTFLALPKYAQFRTSLGEKTFSYGIFQNKELIGTTLIQHIPSKKASFLHIPHGPLLKDPNALPAFLSFYKELGKKMKVDFVRISPLLPENILPVFQTQGFIPAAVHLQNPEKTWILDITKNEEEILANMRKSTRYEVRQGEKLNIEIRNGNTKEDLNIFWKLHQTTVARQGFTPFPYSTSEKELQVYQDDCCIFTAYAEGEALSSCIILFDSHAGYYHQGASIRSKVPVAYAGLWAAIKEAKKRGCKEFNFWGVSDENDKNHPWYGLSYFKRGFGGEEKNFLHAQDFPLTWKYPLARLIEKYRKWKKRY